MLTGNLHCYFFPFLYIIFYSFVVANSFLDFAAQGNSDEVDVGQEVEAANALVFQEATAEAAKQGVGSNHAYEDTGDISEIFKELETEARPEVETIASCRARPSVVESSESEPKERPQA